MTKSWEEHNMSNCYKNKNFTIQILLNNNLKSTLKQKHKKHKKNTGPRSLRGKF